MIAIFNPKIELKALCYQITSAVILLTSFGSSLAVASPLLINGAGATFPYPLYSKWFSDYQKIDPAVQINYQSIGSGGGIRQFSEKTVDFGASDSPMTDEQLKQASLTDGAVIHIPTVLGAVVVTYNLPGNPALKLTAENISDIFLGKVTKWNDPALVKNNPGANLGSDSILVAHRSDGSGTTGIFTDYLSKTSPSWKSKVGAGTAVNWPVGLGGKGNEGVAGIIKQTPGSIGYVELVYAKSNGLSVAILKNSAGRFVEPSLKAVTAAALGALKAMPEDLRISLTDSPGIDAYPISGFTYLLIARDTGSEKNKHLVSFLKWALDKGQLAAEPLSYAPLPKSLLPRVLNKISTIK